MNGLHSCKPGNDPQVGQIKTFVVEQRTGKSGKAYTKITSKAADQGGQPYKILSAKPTGHTDSYGNHSFNIEVEPANNGATQMDQKAYYEASESRQAPARISKDEYWTRKEQRDIEGQERMGRAHSQEMALRYFALVGSKPTTVELREMTSWFQRDIGHDSSPVSREVTVTPSVPEEESEMEEPF